MSGVNKIKSKKKNQRIKIFALAIGLLICCCILLFLLLYQHFWSKAIYKVDSRVKNITKEKKKDQENYQTIGWLRVQGTNIDTPIIGYKKDGIEIPVEKENYLWNEINKEKIYNKVNIMGHNILNLSANPQSGLDYFVRFDDLMSFVYTDFVEENKYIQYTVDGQDYIYKIFAVYFDRQYNLDLHHEGNYSNKKIKEFIKKVKEESIYDFSVDVSENDRVISLITCTRMFGTDTSEELVVVGRMVHDNEKLSNYTVKENNNYKKIEAVMKGDEVNEKA